MNSYLQQMCLPACVLFLCVCLFFFFLIMLLDMKRSRACAPLVLCQSYQRSLPVAGRAEYSRVDSEGSNRANEVVRGVQHWRLMGRACRAANSEAASVISRAWWETTLRSECWGPAQPPDQRAGPLIHPQLERCCSLNAHAQAEISAQAHTSDTSMYANENKNNCVPRHALKICSCILHRNCTEWLRTE